MPFLRFTRDRRGYENTFLLHTDHPSGRPRVLYWYRSAPGVRIGRPALDEDAIRTIEEQHPEIEFDWPHILEVGAASPPEVEHRPVRQRRKSPKPPAGATPPAEVEAPPAAFDDDATTTERESMTSAAAQEREDDAGALEARPHGLLDELVGREIATRLRGRYAEVVARIHQRVPAGPHRDHWEKRAAALDPDAWVTADEILSGVSRADELFDALRRDLLS